MAGTPKSRGSLKASGCKCWMFARSSSEDLQGFGAARLRLWSPILPAPAIHPPA